MFSNFDRDRGCYDQVFQISATTAFGKTVIGTWMIANRSVNTLILVHQTQLMEQWKSAIHKFLKIPVKEIGIIGGGKNKRTGRIDIAMLQYIPNDEESVLLATGRFGGEGLDDARLDTIFLVMPIAWHGTL